MILRTALSSILALAAAPLAAQDTPPENSGGSSYPSIEVLEAFRDGCGAIEDQRAASAALKAADWQPISDSELPEDMRSFLTFAREAGGQGVTAEGGSMTEMEVFEKTVAGERVFAVLSEIRIGGIRVSGCRLFDLGETRRIPAQVVSDWIGRQPTQTLDSEEIAVSDWEPGLLPGHDSFQLFFIPPNSPAKQVVKFDGIALKSDSVGVSE